MTSLILRFIFQGRPRSALLVLGLLVLSAGVLLLTAASETTAVAVDQDLTRYWRTTYDILVRPAGTRSPVEEKYGLVEANHLSGIAGGISFAQYKAIKAIPGVEVVAPVAMLGYVEEAIPTDSLGRLSDPGAYALEETVTVDNGARLLKTYFWQPHYVASDAPPQPREPQARLKYPTLNPQFPIHGQFEMPFLVAGIDPPQEAALVGLDQALLAGEYLTGNEPIASTSFTPTWIGISPSDYGFRSPRTLFTIPILINATAYISLTLQAELKRLILPPEVSDLEDIMARGGREYLASLPGEVVASQELNSQTGYDRLVQSLLIPDLEPVPGPAGFAEFATLHSMASSLPSRITYREMVPPFPYAGLVLEIGLPGKVVYLPGWEPGWLAYRISPGVGSSEPEFSEAQFNVWFSMDAKGVFDIEGIPRPADVNRVPLETYFPPLATLRYDEEGRPVEPRTLRPTLNPNGYIQSPPLILTTLEAARTLRGDDCISAIRVRVGGIGELTPAAQRKIEAVATEIHRRTGLTVDVMVGSSPRRVLVRVPEVGYVEEGWIQKGVNTSYGRRVQSGHFLLLTALLAIGGLYTLDLAWADLLARRRTIALQKALGWRSRTLVAQVLGQALLIGAVATLVGTLAAWGLSAALRLPLPSPPLRVAVPLLVLGLAVVGSLYPAWLTARLPPMPVIQSAGVHHTRTPTWGLRGLWGYAWRGLARRPSRTLLSGLAAALSSALLVLMLAVTLEREGYLAGTLLGEYILVRIERYHYAMVVLGLLLAALAMGNSLLSGVLERQREIGVLKALGWRTGTVARLFMLEGALLGLVGGIGGVLLGGGAFFSLCRVLTPGLARIALLGMGMPALVGVLAALYPARVAAHVPPVEAMRYE